MRKGEAAYQYRPISFIVQAKDLIAPDEIFVNIPQSQIPGIYNYYMISNYGRVYNRFTNSILALQVGTDGYFTVGLSGTFGAKPFRINRLVMMGFTPIQDPWNYDVNHKDGNPKNNCLYNLEWATRSQNIQHAYNIGLMKKGEDGPNAKITNETARKVCILLEQGLKFNDIVEIVGNNVTYGIVQNISIGRDWKDISKDYNIQKRKIQRMFKDNEIESLCMYFETHIKPELITTSVYCTEALKFCNLNRGEQYILAAIRIYQHKAGTRISNKYNF